MDGYVEQNYPDATTTRYGDIISGSVKGGEQLQDLIDDINDGQYDLVIINEISRIDRGGVSISSFIEQCLENDCGVVAQDIDLEIAVDDEELIQIVYTMIAEVAGKIAKIEYRQKTNRIIPGI